MIYKLYCDGAASRNGTAAAIGGWGYAFFQDDEFICANSGQEIGATNQQMELIAALRGCEQALKDFKGAQIEVYTDSAYLYNCYREKWWENWELNGWFNANRRPVANREIWMKLVPFFKRDRFTFIKVAGHSGDKFNEFVDKLARDETKRGVK